MRAEIFFKPDENEQIHLLWPQCLRFRGFPDNSKPIKSMLHAQSLGSLNSRPITYEKNFKVENAVPIR